MTQRQRFDVLRQFPGGFELRRYAAHLVAEVEVESSFADAGSRAFRVLAAFISGRNSTRNKVAMTAPVVQEPSAPIAMTSPVVQEPGLESGRHVVAFVMPEEFTEETLPTPVDPRVRVRSIPEQVAAAKSFNGRWSERICQERLAELRGAVHDAGLEVVGPPRFARFDPPWTPWFLRHHEVVLPVSTDPPSERS